jgi:hypothetical protein
MRTLFCLPLILQAFTANIHASQDELKTSLSDQKNVTLTIYNTDLALIKDQRKVSLKQGYFDLAFRDVSARMRPETAQLRSISSPGQFSVIEQNFHYDLLSPQKLLEKYVGKTVNIVRSNPTTGIETTESAQVLSANGGVVLKMGNRIETGLPGRIVYSDVPENLRDRPTLVMSLKNQGSSQQDVELSYLTSGLKWKADYVIELNANDDKFDISGWVTLNNSSGASYQNANLQLVAGDVNLVQQRVTVSGSNIRAMAAPAPMSEAKQMGQEALFEYHLYTLNRPTSILDNQSKQVALLSATGVPIRKEYLLSGEDHYYHNSNGDLGKKLKTAVFVEFENKETAQLGMPLPKGIIRVYKKDSSGNAQFIGEDTVNHTPKNEKVKLKLGDAFDVTADKKQTDFKKLSGSTKFPYILESAYEIEIKNAKKEAIIVTVQEPIPGDWNIQSESHPHEKTSSNTATWKVKVPAESSTKLKYRSVIRY